ncbi:MAG: GDSL family lipase [Lentisphaerae bacterium GWF2_45_14]|nr:MAG: GDSL family lipase [Lentisphaerae bacterium GWF2_45_14]
MISLEENSKILFIGDSITDCGRKRENASEPGNGYVRFLAGMLGASYAELNLKFINTGISGDRVRNLRARWEEDCLAHKPDVVSIMIGINDTWRRFNAAKDHTDTAAYKKDYEFILRELESKLKCQIVIVEPFLLPVPEDRKEWRIDLDPKIGAARELAAEYAAAYVPLDGIFAAAALRNEAAYWTPDGVHPSIQGHMLIAESWLEYTGL